MTSQDTVIPKITHNLEFQANQSWQLKPQKGYSLLYEMLKSKDSYQIQPSRDLNTKAKQYANKWSKRRERCINLQPIIISDHQTLVQPQAPRFRNEKSLNQKKRQTHTHQHTQTIENNKKKIRTKSTMREINATK